MDKVVMLVQEVVGFIVLINLLMLIMVMMINLNMNITRKIVFMIWLQMHFIILLLH